MAAASAVDTSKTSRQGQAEQRAAAERGRRAWRTERGPGHQAAAATQARAASGSAVSIALVRKAVIGTSIAPLQSSVSASDEHGAAPTAMGRP